MKKGLFAVFVSMMLMALAPLASAHAESIRDVVINAGGDDVAITFRTEGPVLAPQIKTVAGRVTLTFDAALARRAMAVHGDGTYVQRVDLRSAAGGVSIANIGLPGGTRLSPTRVRIETRDDGVVVRIAKSAITLPAPEPVAAAPVAPAPAPAAVPVVAVPSLAAPAPIAPVAAAPAAAGTTTQEPAPAAPLAARNASAFAGAIPASAGPSVPVIIFVTLLLAAGYFGVRLILQRRGPRPTPAIDVIASKRLGARHQLIIVRAFGRDHLLSVQGNTTTRIATTRSPVAAIAKMEKVAQTEETPRIKRLEALRDDDGAIGLADLRLSTRPQTIPPPAVDDVQPVRNGYGQARKSMAPRAESIPAPANSEVRAKISLSEETRFGAELMKLVRASVAPPAQQSSARQLDDAAQGIMRLRKQTSR